MQPNAFIGHTSAPNHDELIAALGSAYGPWEKLLAELARDDGVTAREWSSYSPKAGWALRVKRKGRTILWMSPLHEAFCAAVILGPKALAATRGRKLPRTLVAAIDFAPHYPEGAGVRLVVKSERELPPVKTLARIKLAN